MLCSLPQDIINIIINYGFQCLHCNIITNLGYYCNFHLKKEIRKSKYQKIASRMY